MSFPPETWSVYRRNVCTNNDLEGWHHRLNHAAHTSKLPFYLLLELLKQEATHTDITVKLLSDRKVNRIQRVDYSVTEEKIDDIIAAKVLWDLEWVASGVAIGEFKKLLAVHR